MKIEALVEFDGDFGEGTPVVRYAKGQQFEAPERVIRKWLGRGLVTFASQLDKSLYEAPIDDEYYGPDFASDEAAELAMKHTLTVTDFIDPPRSKHGYTVADVKAAITKKETDNG